MPLVNAGYGPIVSLGATTHDGALTRQLPELLLDELLELEELLEELEMLELLDELEELEELLDDDSSPPQPATVKAPNALRACRRVKWSVLKRGIVMFVSPPGRMLCIEKLGLLVDIM